MLILEDVNCLDLNFIMSRRTTLTTLPPELRKLVYEYVALAHTTRRIKPTHDGSVGSSGYRITTSSMTATCRLIHNEYEDVARKLIARLEFTVKDMNFNHIIEYFHGQANSIHLADLQSNRAILHINMVVCDDQRCKIDINDFYIWALFVVGTDLQAEYHGDRAAWMAIFDANGPNLTKQCQVTRSTASIVRDNMESIRDVARVFDKALWRAYAEFRGELQARRHREWDRRTSIEATAVPELEDSE